MHTSKALQCSDYRFFYREKNQLHEVDFDSFYPDYKKCDRISVVSPMLENGVVHASYALLAITSQFYERMAREQDDFYDYPHHFGIFDVSNEGVAADKARFPDEEDTFGSWAWLDVWPSSQWLRSSGTISSMLETVFANQTQCLFWPANWLPDGSEKKLPCYVKPLLESRLKCVYLYNSQQPDMEIHVTDAVENMVELECRSRFPDQLKGRYSPTKVDSNSPHTFKESLQKVDVKQFLDSLDSCFEKDTTGAIKRSSYYSANEPH